MPAFVMPLPRSAKSPGSLAAKAGRVRVVGRAPAVLALAEKGGSTGRRGRAPVDGADARMMGAAAMGAAVLAPVMPALADEGAAGGYSLKSYYTVLGLFAISLPGLWSLVKRAPAPKPLRKTFVAPGPAVPGAPPTSAIAREVALHFKKINYRVKGTPGEVITFEGAFAPSKGQAAYVVTCAALGLASTALVLSIQFPFAGNAWYLMTLFAPFAGQYYWENAERVETVKVKMVTSDDETEVDIIMEASKDEIERFGEEVPFVTMKGMKRVRGVFEKA